MEQQVVFLVGAPGAGKSTHCQNIEKNFGFKHVTVGNLFKEECKKSNSELGNIINAAMKEGDLLSGVITCMVINSAMENSKTDKYFTDGFPRSVNNREEWDKTMGEINKVLFVILFDCPKEVCRERCLERAKSTNSRKNDTSECFEKRWNTYINETMPVIESLKKNYKVKIIKTNAEPDEVYLEVKKTFNDAGVNQTENLS